MKKLTLDYIKTKLGISIGDYNGISMEVLLKAFSHPSTFNYCTPVLYAHPSIVKYYAKQLGLEDVKFHIIKDTKDCKTGYINLKVISGDDIIVESGKATTASGNYAVFSLQKTVDDIKSGQIHNLVTLPINKSNTNSNDFPFAGHTDFLAKSFGSDNYMMLLVSDEMRIGMVTGHVPISDVSKHINQEIITRKLNIFLETLKLDFNITKPKIAVLGLNPHSGDNGLIGREEKDIIFPAIKTFVDKGDLVFGPYPADGFFGNKLYQQFDGVLAMYHDQGLIPFKQLSFSDGVNYTAGLPTVRTSPDHGTAMDIAGKNLADPSSFINAIFLQRKIYISRVENMELNKNPLPFSRHRREKFSIGVPNLK